MGKRQKTFYLSIKRNIIHFHFVVFHFSLPYNNLEFYEETAGGMVFIESKRTINDVGVEQILTVFEN